MNRIFRRVWNVSLQQWVVASELASGHRPAGASPRPAATAGTTRAFGLPLGILCAALFSAPLAAQEFTVTDGDNDAVVGQGGTVTFTGDPNIRVTQTGSNDDAEIVIQLERGIDVDTVTAGATRLDMNGVAVGTAALRGNGLTLGAGAPSITTAGIQAGNLAIAGVGNGTAADHAVNLSQLQAVQAQAGAGWNVAVGADAYNIGPDGRVTFSGDANLDVALTGADDAAGVAFTLNRNLNLDSVAAGTTSLTGTGVQVGNAVRLISTGLTITGGPSVTTAGIDAGNRVITNVADGAVSAASTEAVNGRQIFALRQELFVEGEGVKYFHANSTLADSQATGLESVAIGPRTVAAGASSFAAGDGAATTVGAAAGIALGQGATAGTATAATPDGAGSVAIGRNASAAGDSTIALGDGARVGSEFVSNSLAIGTNSSVTGGQSNRATAVGYQATASAANATALGALAAASGGNSIAIGQATALAGNALAAGAGAYAGTARGIALGSNAGVGTVGNEAGDRTDHIAVGTNAGQNVAGNQTTAIGYSAGSNVRGDDNVALGTEAGRGLDGNNNISIGTRANDGAGARAQAIAIGDRSAAGTNSVAVGSGARAAGDETVALGKDSSAGSNGVALGALATAQGSNIALGRNSAARDSDVTGAGYLTGAAAPGSAVSVGNSSAGVNLQRRIVNVADGAQRYDAVNVGQLQAAQRSVTSLIGGGVQFDPATGTYGVITIGGTEYSNVADAISAAANGQITEGALPPNVVRYESAGNSGRIANVAQGVQATDAVNLQQLNEAVAENGVKYFSANSVLEANRGNDGATGENAMAIGPAAVAGGSQSLAVGQAAVVDAGADHGVAVGNNVNAKAVNSTAIGNNGTAAYNVGGVAIGQQAVSRGINSIVMGTGAEADPKTGGTVNNAIVIGTEAEATADEGVAIGRSALASELRAVAQGSDAHALAVDAIAVGTESRATGVRSQASGTNANASGTDSVATGTRASGQATHAIAIGTDAVSGFAPAPGQEGLNVNTIAIGHSARAIYQDATAIGRASLASEVAATAIGDAAIARAEASLAVGRNANASGVSSIAQGDGAIASAEAAEASGRGANASGISSIAQGDRAVASANRATALGQSAQATQVSATALGDDAQASGLNAIAVGHAARASQAGASAFGNDARAEALSALALGQGSRALHSNAVALGSGATTAAAVPTQSGIVGGLNYTYAGGTPLATVSVGTVGQERTITNVAAGRVNNNSTDAINGSQLFSTQQAVGNVANSVRNVLGGNAVLSNNGTVSVSNIGDTGQNTIHDAINYAAQGWAVSANGEAAGQRVAPGGAVDFSNDDDNIEIGRDGTNLKFNLAENIDLGPGGSVRTGNTLVNSGGVTVGIGGSQTAIGAGTITATGGGNSVRINAAGGGTVNGLTNTSFDPANFTSGQAATEDQLAIVSNAVAAGWNIRADDEVTGGNVTPNGNVNLRNDDDNLVITRDGTDVTFDLAKDIDLGADGSLKAGDAIVDTTGIAIGADVKLGASGLTITGGPSVGVTGIDAGDLAITGVAAGQVSATSQEAVNGSQLHGAGTSIANIIGGNATLDSDGRISGSNIGGTGENTIHDAIAYAAQGWAVGANGEAAGQTVAPGAKVDFSSGNGNIEIARTGADLVFTLADDIELNENGSVAIGDGIDGSLLDADGLTVSSGGSTTSVGAGAITMTDGTHTTSIGSNAISVGGSNPVQISGDSGTIGGLANRTWNPGSITSGQAATEDQLKAVSDVANAGWNIRANDEATGGNVAPNGSVNLRNDDANLVITRNGTDVTFDLAENIDLGTDGTVRTGETVIDTTGVAVGADVKLGSTGLAINGGPSLTLAGIDAGNRVITGVADGAALTDAVNVGQLQGAVEAGRTKYYSVNSTGGGNFDNDGATGDDAIAAGKDATADGDEAIALGIGGAATGDGGIAIGARAQALSLNSLAIGAGAVSSHANSIALGAGSATTIGAQTGYQGAFVGSSDSTGELNVGGRQVTGVAAGSAATDAVNVSQLQGGVDYAINESNSYTDGQIDGVNNRIDVIDGRVTAIEGDIIDIQGDITDIQGDIVDIRGDITDLDDRVSSVEGVVVEVGGRLDSLETGASGPFQISQGEAYVAPTPSGQNASAGGNGAVASGNNSVALGNQSQATGAGSTAVGQGAKATAANSTALGQGATASHANSVALGAGSATTVGAQSNYNGAYVGSSSSTGEVNVGGRTISGVAPGIAGTDAVNVNQLTGGVNQAINVANQYTDGRITQIQDDMWSIERGYRGATSSAMAMAGLPQAYLPGKSMLAVGVGGYQSEYGMAVGLSGITENGRYVYRAQASGNTARDWGFSVGAGIQW